MAFGRLEGEASPTVQAEINTTPLVDVMLVLLVVMMVAAPMLSANIALQLPQTHLAASTPPEPALTLSINAQGQYFLAAAPLHPSPPNASAQPLNLEQLRPALAQARQQHPTASLSIRADRRVNYDLVAQALALAQAQAWPQLSLSTQAQ